MKETKDPLQFINNRRALIGERPLDPQKPRGQDQPWTQFDIEHFALSCGWKPPAGYRLAMNPKFLITDPKSWWREFFTRYYRSGEEQGQGWLPISHNFGGVIGTLEIGEILKRADFEISPMMSPSLDWPRPEDTDHSPDRYRECAMEAIRRLEKHGLAKKATWPLSEFGRGVVVDLMAMEVAPILTPRDSRAMPAE